MLPAISRIYHLSCRGFFNVPCEIPGTRDLGFKSHPQDFSDQKSVESYSVLPIYGWVNRSTTELSHMLTVTTRQGVRTDQRSDPNR